MTEVRRFVLDANVFITASRSYYAFDLAPGFWRALIEHARNQRLVSIDRVKIEILRGKDRLAEWAQMDFNDWFESTDQDDVLEAYRKIVGWVQSENRYRDAAKAEFASSADGWLVAYALSRECVVVTHETLDNNIRTRVKIPNICQQFSIEYINLFEMLRRLNIKV